MGFHLQSVFHCQALRFIKIWDSTVSSVVIPTWWFFPEMQLYNFTAVGQIVIADPCMKLETHAGVTAFYVSLYL